VARASVVNKLITNKSSVFTGEDLTWLAPAHNCIKNMNSGRVVIDYSLIPNTPMTLLWLRIHAVLLKELKSEAFLVRLRRI